jgi:hypothetical protein
MVASRTIPGEPNRGFVLAEIVFSAGAFAMVTVALLLGFSSLERNYSASTDFALNHSDEMRISDYLALDLRRALSLHASQNDTTINIPDYYDNARTPRMPTLDGHGGVYYGATGSFVSIRYYLSGGTIYRKEGNLAGVALATNVADFVFDVTDSGKVVTTKITFKPTFVATGASSAAKTGTSFYNTTLLRNNRIDIQSGVY